MSSPARLNLSIESAACSPSMTSRIDTRCNAKRSRSLITPSSRPFSTTTVWRIPCSAITCIASYAVADPGNVMIGAVITSDSGVSSDRLVRTTRRSRSTSVNMPIGVPPASTTTIVRTLASAIFWAASRSVAAAGQATGEWRTSSPSVRVSVCCSAARWLNSRYRLSSDSLSVSVIAWVQ